MPTIQSGRVQAGTGTFYFPEASTASTTSTDATTLSSDSTANSLPVGSRGVAGPTGPTGPAGPSGPTGPALNHTLSKTLTGNMTLGPSDLLNTAFYFSGSLNSTTTVTFPGYRGLAVLRNITAQTIVVQSSVNGHTASVPAGAVLMMWSDGTDCFLIGGGGSAPVVYPTVSITDGIFTPDSSPTPTPSPTPSYPSLAISDGSFVADPPPPPAAPSWTTSAGSLGSFMVGNAITPVQLAAQNVNTYAVTTGSLPTGLMLSSTGLISGTPSSAGDVSFAITATGTGGTVARTFSFSITAPPALSRLSTQGSNIIDADGNVVVLKGVNWHGAEGSTHLPNGLWQADYKKVIDDIKSLGFNCIRLPMSADYSFTATPNGGLVVSSQINTDLSYNMKAIEIVDKIIDYAGARGIWIFFDCHRLTAGAGTDSAISSDNLSTIQAWWQAMATRYAGNSTICGADLYNEPYTVDWQTLAGFYETLGNAIHAIAPEWLILCEGGALPQGAPNGAWWGAALEGVATRPVTLTQPNKTVYSPHEYGISVSQQVWLQSSSNSNVANWPNNLDTIWSNNWDFIRQNTIAPLLIGEYGGKLGYAPYSGQLDAGGQPDYQNEQAWFTHLVSYMQTHGISSTFWTMTAESSDTGGLYAGNDTTLVQGKIALLAGYVGS